jgi:hypothetical protein
MLNYKDFCLIRPNEDQSIKISQIIEERNGSVFQEIDLNEIVQKHFNTELFYFVDSPSNIENFSVIHITKNKFAGKCFNFKPLYDIPYAGFIDDTQIDFNSFSIGFFESINYCGYPRSENKYNNQELLSFGETCTVDLNLNEDDIFNNVIHSKRRNMIRKAEKSGISVKKFFSNEGMIHFWPMLDELHKKLGFTRLPKEYYTDIIDTYGMKKQACILVAFKDEEPISGTFILGNKNYMLYYKGASVFGVKNEGQGELLQWEAIKLSKSLGIKCYDLGNLQKELLPSIYKFKTGISNNIIQYPVYSKNSLGYKVINKINSFLK